MKHINRKLSLELASILVALLVFGTGFFVWRISQGPTRVDFLKPVVRGLFHARTNMHLQIDHLSISASGKDAPVEITLTGLAIARSDKAPLATIDGVSITISHHGLLSGDVHPIAIGIEHPVLVLAGLQKPQSPPSGSKKSGGTPPDILHALANPKSDGPLSCWEEISIRDGSIQFLDNTPLVTGITVDLKRTAVGFTGETHGVYQNATGDDLNGAVEVNRGQHGTASLHSAPIMLSYLAGLPSLSFLENYKLPVEATITANLDDTAIADTRIDLAIGQGIIDDPILPQPAKISGGNAEIIYKAKPEHAELRHLDIDLDGPKIAANGTADSANGKMDIDANLKISDLPIDRFAEFWPEDVSKGGRKWVLNHMSKGAVQSAGAHMTATGARDDLGSLEVSSFDGTMNVAGSTVKYFGQLPEVKNASADIDYNRSAMTIHMTGGQADDIVITGGTVTLDGFDGHDQAIKIDLNLSGPVASALDLVDQQPLGYAQKLKLKPHDFGGIADTNVQMHFPLVDSISVDDLNVATASSLHNVSLPHAVANRDLNGLNGNLWIGTGGMELIGAGALVDIPVTLDYRQSFEKNGATIALFSGSTGNRQRAELGFDFPDRVQGKIDVAGTYKAQGGAGSVDVTLDLTPGIFAIDEIGYAKKPGEAGIAKLLVNLKKGSVVSIDPISVEAPKFSASGSAEFDGGKLTTLTLAALKADETDMSMTVTPADNGGSKIAVKGSEFDARRFLHERHEKNAKPETPDANPAPLEINVDLDTVKTSDTNGLSAVKGQLVLLGTKWRRADFKAVASGSPVFLSYLPDSDEPNTSYTLHAGAQDAGAAIAGFALTNSIKGGVLKVDGVKAASSDDQPNPPLTGAVALTGFSLENAPIFARLLNLLSVTGLGKAISSSAIHFDFFKSKFEIDNGAVKIADGRLRGDAIGLTIAGTVDRDAGTLDLYGTAVPAYGANRMLNAIPVLGPLLTGGEGQGVFAATYSIDGAIENPNVSANPLSAFAPGVLRDLLFGTSDPAMDSGD